MNRLLATRSFYLVFLLSCLVITVRPSDVRSADPLLVLQPNDHIAYIGNTLADRMQHHGWLECYLHALHPDHQLTVRNLGFAGDELANRPRSQNFGTPDQWLTKVEADVVLCFFGYNEALRGEASLPEFRQELSQTIQGMLAQQYNGHSAPRLVFFSPIAHENLNDPNLPDGSANNRNLALYTQAMREVCQQLDVAFVDLFRATQQLYQDTAVPLTMNGIHLLEYGNRAVAEAILPTLLGSDKMVTHSEAQLERLREAILDKNLYWFSRYRVVDGYNVYGGRSKLNWFGQSNYDVMQREMEIFDIMTANRDQRVWAVAAGGDLRVVDDNLPPELEVPTSKAGELDGGRHAYLGGKEAISRMTTAPNMKVNLFASEEQFPELINPVQMAVDTDGRLFVSVWPSYPHWNPTKPREDRILCLPDEDGDGVADRVIVFADQLNSVTGFEFWGGGMLVAAPPEIWFLRDTDGDDRADFRLRMLQGVSSADSHHTANSLLIGPDGGLYWSRGIFHVTNMETPTKTFRQTQSGVYRFDPRTFEVDFHFPIGPNPHGDVIDQWGFQFANDGTSGTGSYINIGKGRGNKQWFKKRVRPVAATGILSSSHFPPENNGNFLICNTIGFLGVLQHQVKFDGADILAEEIAPIVYSTDPNFRPSDIEVGGDGALYISDWCNALIGHMQHNIRDPNRDDQHGRIYRVTYEGRPLLKPVKLKNKPIPEVLAAFHALENGTRYRARLELSGRDTDDVVAATERFAATLDAGDPQQAQALLECLWVFQEHRVVNRELLTRVYQAADPRIRAAAIRTLGQWGPKMSDWESILVTAARDEAPLVRAEAVKAATSFSGLAAAEVIFEVAAQPTDAEIARVLDYGRSQMNIDDVVRESIESDRPLSSAARAYALQHAPVEALLRLTPSVDLYRAVLARDSAPAPALQLAVDGLAQLTNQQPIQVLLQHLAQPADGSQNSSLAALGQLLVVQPVEQLQASSKALRQLANEHPIPSVRQAAMAARMIGETPDRVFASADESQEQLRDALEAVSLLPESKRAPLYPLVRPLVDRLPEHLNVDPSADRLAEVGVQVEYFQPHPKDASLETFSKATPTSSGRATEIKIDGPYLQRRDQFGLRFTGWLNIDAPGKYQFYVTSDDGSRLYIHDDLVVNNDGNHGVQEKSGSIELASGSHPFTLNYFDSGGGDALKVAWSGPGFGKQPVPGDRLSTAGTLTVHDVAIRTLSLIPGHDAETASVLGRLIRHGRHQPTAINAMLTLPIEALPSNEISAVAEALAAYVAEIPTRLRTTPAALRAMNLADALADRLPEDQARAYQARLADLAVTVIRIGTVPHRMIYDKERLAVQAGKPVEFVFTNTDNMPHNFAVVLPGTLEEVGLLAEATARQPDAMARHYIPATDNVLVSSRLLQPTESQAIPMNVPSEPGIYPYVCTYPGHWRRMYGALYVVADLKDYLANPEEYLTRHPLKIHDELLKYNTRDVEWTMEELSAPVASLADDDHDHHHSAEQAGDVVGRSFEVGHHVFKVANCMACHRLNNEGHEFGPDLAKLDDKKRQPLAILQSILTPEKEIEEKYQTYAFELSSGQIISGMILEETSDEVKVIIDPIAKAEPTSIRKSEIEERTRLAASTMPKGLLSKLSREEVLDLIAYVYAGGDKNHRVFTTHEH